MKYIEKFQKWHKLIEQKGKVFVLKKKPIT